MKKITIPPGTRYGMLTVLEEVGSIKRRNAPGSVRRVKCLCDCGKVKTFRLPNLVNSITKSCGCLRRSKVQLHVGETHNYVTILYGFIGAKSQAYVNVKCKCGKEKVVRLAAVLNNTVKSCGCIVTENIKECASSVDGEIYKCNVGSNGYAKVFLDEKRQGGGRIVKPLHVLEAQKVYAKCQMPWNEDFIVHHIDGGRVNNDLSNLSVFGGHGEHRKHHDAMEKATFKFLAEKGLLEEFYSEHPELRVTTLEDLL